MGRRVHLEAILRRSTAVPLWLQALPVALLVLTSLLQIYSRDPTIVGFPTAIVPLVAAFFLGPLGITAMAAVVGGLMFTSAFRPADIHMDDLIAYTVVWSFGIGFAWMRTRFQARLVTVESVAEAAQYAVLPSLPERVGGLTCAGFYHSAQSGARIGGDLFDVRASPFGIRMILGDVQGHGLPAVGTAGKLLACFHEAILDESDLAGIASRLERRIVVDTDEGYIPELFASVLLVEFRDDIGEMRLLSCGHPPPLVLRADRIEEVVLKPCPLLGLRLGSRARPPFVTTVPFRPEEILLAYSDGLSEARDPRGRYYPLSRRLDGLVLPPAPQRLIDFVWEDLTRFAARLDDDVSLLAVARADGAPERASNER